MNCSSAVRGMYGGFMSTAFPPSEDDESAYIFVDHRSEDGCIVEWVSERLASKDALSVRADGTALFVTHRGREYRLPLTISGHDRCVAISSLAELLKNDYRFFVLAPWRGSDAHGLLVVPESQMRAWGSIPEHLEPLRFGFDYFNGINIPYLNHEDSAPNWATESEAARLSGEALMRFYGVFLLGTKELDPGAAAAFAKAAVKDPTLREFVDWPENASEAEIAAIVEKAIDEGLQGAGLKEWRSEFDNAMQDLRTATDGPPWEKK